jgi:hypothetical protein
MQVVRTHVPPPSSLSGCLSEMQVLLDCLRPLWRAHFTRTKVKIVAQTWILIRNGPYTSLRSLRLISRDDVHLHTEQAIIANRNLPPRYCIPRKYVPLHFGQIGHIKNTRVILHEKQSTYKMRRSSRNYCCHGKAAGFTYIFWVCVCVCVWPSSSSMQSACAALHRLPYFSTSSQKAKTFLTPCRIQRDIINTHTSSCKAPAILVRF